MKDVFSTASVANNGHTIASQRPESWWDEKLLVSAVTLKLICVKRQPSCRVIASKEKFRIICKVKGTAVDYVHVIQFMHMHFHAWEMESTWAFNLGIRRIVTSM